MSTTAARWRTLLPHMDLGRTSPAPTRDTPGEIGGAPAEITADEQDIIWMIRVRNGDRAAFERLVDCHQQRVVGTVARMLGSDSADAEDVGQQVFLRVWKSAARYEPTAKFTTWLYTITRNLVFNELRRRKHRPTVSLDADPAREGAMSSDAFARIEDPQAATPDASLLEAELQTAISAAIADLPETQRLALVLRRYEDLSYEEIGASLNLSVPAIKSLLFRARTLLREKLARYLDEKPVG